MRSIRPCCLHGLHNIRVDCALLPATPIQDDRVLADDTGPVRREEAEVEVEVGVEVGV